MLAAPTADPSAWPESAGTPPPKFDRVYKDPPPRYFDPPAGLYSKGDGTLVETDPPRGYYDPPPGYYPRDRHLALTYHHPLGPLPRPLSDLEIWEKKHRQRKIALAISATALGIAVLAPIVSAIQRAVSSPPPPDVRCIDCWDPGIVIFLSLGPPALISTTVSGALLGVHAKRRPSQQVSLSPSGLTWRF